VSAYANAQDAVEYVRQQMKVVSTNRVGDPPLNQNTEKAADQVSDAFAKLKSEYSSDIEFGPTAALAQATLAFRIGNCANLAALAFAFLAERDTARPLELLLVDDGDHDFVVLGRTVDSPNWTTWNKEAVICDAWSEKVVLQSHMGAWLEGVARLCLDKPTNWVEKREIVEDTGLGFTSKRITMNYWRSVKVLLTEKAVDKVELSQSVLLPSGTWSYNITKK
jgi:hypothetical protein